MKYSVDACKQIRCFSGKAHFKLNSKRALPEKYRAGGRDDNLNSRYTPGDIFNILPLGSALHQPLGTFHLATPLGTNRITLGIFKIDYYWL